MPVQTQQCPSLARTQRRSFSWSCRASDETKEQNQNGTWPMCPDVTYSNCNCTDQRTYGLNQWKWRSSRYCGHSTNVCVLENKLQFGVCLLLKRGPLQKITHRCLAPTVDHGGQIGWCFLEQCDHKKAGPSSQKATTYYLDHPWSYSKATRLSSPEMAGWEKHLGFHW